MTKGARAVALKDAGFSNEEIAGILAMPKSSVRRLISETKDRSPENASAAPYAPQEATSLLIIPDTQCKPNTDLSYMEWAGRYIADREPDIVVHLGDHWDLPSLSSYEQKGSKFFEGKRYLADVEAGNEGLRLLERGMGGFKPRRKVLLRGNHENRSVRAVEADPKLEGLIGYHLFNDVELGWEVHDFLAPVEIEGVTFSHYFYWPHSGRPYTGTVENILKNVGFSFVAGHQQGLRFARRELANGKVQVGIVAGSYYLEPEVYRGPQATNEWRGLIVCHEVHDGSMDPMFVSMNFLQRRFG